jgi:hypothetical protein
MLQAIRILACQIGLKIWAGGAELLESNKVFCTFMLWVDLAQVFSATLFCGKAVYIGSERNIMPEKNQTMTVTQSLNPAKRDGAYWRPIIDVWRQLAVGEKIILMDARPREKLLADTDSEWRLDQKTCWVWHKV